MKPSRPVIIWRASTTWVVDDAPPEEPSGLQFWIAQMPVSATAVRNPNLMPGLLVMRCTASTMGLCNISSEVCQHAVMSTSTYLLKHSAPTVGALQDRQWNVVSQEGQMYCSGVSF